MLRMPTRDVKKPAVLSKRNFQPQKIFVENLKDAKSIEHLETDICDFFSNFGTVIDTKVLRNGKLTRQQPAVCLRYLQG
jgi:hypothetical protein